MGPGAGLLAHLVLKLPWCDRRLVMSVLASAFPASPPLYNMCLSYSCPLPSCLGLWPKQFPLLGRLLSPTFIHVSSVSSFSLLGWSGVTFSNKL